jgi:hypothetical protein
MRRPRMTIRGVMCVVLAASLLFAMVRLANELRYWTFSYGWNTSVLETGTKAVMYANADFYGVAIPAGTQVIVTSDLTDEDSAYPYRKVAVEVIAGPHKGAFGTVDRTQLRVQ